MRAKKPTQLYGPDHWLPDETLQALRQSVVAIKGPLTTPVGGGIRSLNVALRQQRLTCTSASVRCATSRACPRHSKHPEKTNMVIFRENSEDIYAGIEFAADSPQAHKLIAF